MLRRYEIIFIAHADLTDDQLSELIERYKKIITDSKGVIVKIEKWGTRKLAYEIKKQTKGTYVLTDFVGKVNIIPEIERNFKIDDKILKFLTVLKDKEVDLEELEKEKQTEGSAESKISPPKKDNSDNYAESSTEGLVEVGSTQETKEGEE